MALATVRDLYGDKIKDLYSAENQILKALPRMIKNANMPELQQALQEHLNVTATHAQRLEEIAAVLGKNAKSKTCVGMEGLIEQGKELLQFGKIARGVGMTRLLLLVILAGIVQKNLRATDLLPREL